MEKWNLLDEIVPSPSIHGEKLLVYRVMNESQRNMAYSILDTTLIRFCQPKETWWCELPNPPINQ